MALRQSLTLSTNDQLTDIRDYNDVIWPIAAARRSGVRDFGQAIAGPEKTAIKAAWANRTGAACFAGLQAARRQCHRDGPTPSRLPCQDRIHSRLHRGGHDLRPHATIRASVH